MTDSIIENINNTCRKTDKLLVLGDFCLNTSFSQFQELIHRISPKLLFVRGNHNSPWEKEFTSMCQAEYGFDECYPFKDWLGYVDVLGDYVRLSWNKQFVVCNHYAYQVWDKSHHNSWSLVSHSHGTLPTILPDCKDGKQLDCGWDVNEKPLSFDDISSIMNKKQISFKDHHNSQTT